MVSTSVNEQLFYGCLFTVAEHFLDAVNRC